MKKRGFSLIELLVVVAIIGILSVILVPNVKEQLRRAKVAKTKALIGSLTVAISAYKTDFGKYPSSYDAQGLFIALVEKAKFPYEPDSDEYRLIEKGDSIYINPDMPDDRIENLLQNAGVKSGFLRAQEEENVFVDAWDNPLYYVNYVDYNPGGRTDFRKINSNSSSSNSNNAACAYEMRDEKRYKPFKPSTFQLISFGPDGTTITPSRSNGGIGSMIDSDKKDNDGDDKFDNEDRVRAGDRSKNDPEVVAEDDVTNFQ